MSLLQYKIFGLVHDFGIGQIWIRMPNLNKEPLIRSLEDIHVICAFIKDNIDTRQQKFESVSNTSDHIHIMMKMAQNNQ